MGGGKVMAFCGIGKPDDFFATLEKAEVNVVSKKTFPDHHRFRLKDLQSLENDARDIGAKYLVTTEKDAVKLAGLNISFPILVTRVKMFIIEGEEVFERLLSHHVE